METSQLIPFITSFLESAGTASISYLWIPAAVWLIAVLTVLGLLRLAANMDALYHYHIRTALILSLPAPSP
ncbi:hypothetical protein QA596_01250 [Balneolales bacterium ANBcel1]|nr:hypothetical protein [Balneolales bacterium ANBcel1]